MNWNLQLFLLLLWGLGIVVALNKPMHPKQETIFNYQNWNIWIGVIAATIIKIIVFFGAEVLRFWEKMSSLLVGYICMEASIFIGILLIYRLMTKQCYAVLGFHLDRFGTRILYGSRWIVGFFLVYNGFKYFLFSLLSEERLSGKTINKENIGTILKYFENTWGTRSLWVPFFVDVILSPVIEEIVFRGFLYGPIRKKWGQRSQLLQLRFYLLCFTNQIMGLTSFLVWCLHIYMNAHNHFCRALYFTCL